MRRSCVAWLLLGGAMALLLLRGGAECLASGCEYGTVCWRGDAPVWKLLSIVYLVFCVSSRVRPEGIRMEKYDG